MFKKIFLFVTTILVAVSVSTGFGSTDSLKGEIDSAIFLDWFHHTEKYIHATGLIVLDLIPMLFLIVQIVLFFKDNKKSKGIFALLALVANIVGVVIAIQLAHPISTQMTSWTADNLPSDWVSIKDNWIDRVGLYGLLGILGWLCFVITYFVGEKRNAAVKQLPRFLNFLKNAITFFLTFLLGMGLAGLYENFFLHFEQTISGNTFIEMHRSLDLVIRKVGPIVFGIITVLHAVLAALFFAEKSKQKGWLIIIAYFFLLCDTFIALQLNRPLNDLFLTWTSTTIPANWSALRDEWMDYHFYRNIFKALGVCAILLIYFVPKKEPAVQPL